MVVLDDDDPFQPRKPASSQLVENRGDNLLGCLTCTSRPSVESNNVDPLRARALSLRMMGADIESLAVVSEARDTLLTAHTGTLDSAAARESAQKLRKMALELDGLVAAADSSPNKRPPPNLLVERYEL